MNVWLLQIGESVPIDNSARKLRTAMLADKIVERGHNVIWWASAFDHFKKDWVFKNCSEVTVGKGITVFALGGIGYKKNISLSRFVDHRIIATQFRRSVQRYSAPDIIVASMPSYDLAYEAVMFGQKNNIPTIIDIRDQWPDLFIENIPAAFRNIARIVLRNDFQMLKKAITAADSLVSMMETLLKWGLTYAGRERSSRDRVFYLGYKRASNIVGSADNIADMLNELKGKFVVTFIGTFSTYHNPSVLVEIAREFAENNVCFVLAGDGELFQEIKKRAASLKNIFFPGWLNQDEISTLLQHSHVGVCPSGHANNKNFFPNKVFMYFSESLPILSAFQGEIAEIIEKFQVGYTYNSTEEFVRGLRNLYYDSVLYNRMKTNVTHLYNSQCDADKIYSDYAEHIENLAERR
jgi:glycosyltransferase involved in cell wall biosynthesis